MTSWFRKQEFDRFNIVGTAIAALLTMGLAVVVRPILILSMSAQFWALVTFVIGAPLGYFAQHTSDKIVSAMCGGYMKANHATAALLDALRTLIYAAIEAGICILVIVTLVVFSK